jgi:tetratricopeptide (TPR) repeat protein
MAKLGIKETFRARCGTENIYDHTFSVEVVFSGQIKGDFVSGVDYDCRRRGLREVIKDLEGKYLNEIIGRATDENIAVYLLYRLRSFPIYSLRLTEDDKNYIEVVPEDCDLNNFESVLSMNRGKFLLVSGKYRQGIKEFTVALHYDPKLFEAYNFRGRCYKKLNQNKKSLLDFSRAIELDQNFGEAYRNRGNAYYNLQNDDLMIEDFNKAIELMPSSAVAFNNRGFALQRLKKYDLAILDHTKAIELDGQYAEAYRDRGDAFKALNELKKAELDYQEAEKLEKKQEGKNHEVSKVYF